MNFLSLPLKKRNKIAIGLMSGTSLDSVDAVLVEINDTGKKTKIKQHDFISFPFPEGLREKLLSNSNPSSGNVTDICRLNFTMAHLYSDAVNNLLTKNKLESKKINFIGSHGQTIHHLPEKENLFGYNSGSTLQIGDPAVIAKKTGILTVGDFRTGDVALGGEGAPLVPYFDYVLFKSSKKNIALLNIGGISNITYLKKNARPEEVIAFDTGPGNMMIDLLSKKFFNLDYDKDGKIASSGQKNQSLFDKLVNQDKFINRTPPKSTGREYYGENYLNSAIGDEIIAVPKEDILSTVSEFTAYSVYISFQKHIQEFPDELIVSGGGANNKFLMKKLKQYFGKKTEVKKINIPGLTSDAKEAVCFAFLANETLSLRPSNLPGVTGAERATILGKICLP